MSKFFYTDGNGKYGPFSKEELRNQKISRNTNIWYYGLDKWTELSKIPELSDVFFSIPPEIKSPDLSDKTKDVKPHTQQTNTIPTKSNDKKGSNVSKWLIGIAPIVIIFFFVYLSIRDRSDVNIYNGIVSNSYTSDEKFEMYVEKFYRDLEYFGIYPKKPKRTIIKFSRLDQLDNATHIHGLSLGGNDDDKIEVYINPSTWKSFNKPMRYFLMYHELAHDVLNIDDLEATASNEGKLMYPEISSYENKNMDDFIKSAHALFEEHSTE